MSYNLWVFCLTKWYIKMLSFHQAVLSPMPCEWQKEESPETHQKKSRVCLFSSPSVVLCSEMAAAMLLLQRASPLSMGKCNKGLRDLILSQVYNPFFLVLISHSLISHKFKLELHIQIIPQDRYMKFGVKWSNLYTFSSFGSINHSMAHFIQMSCKLFSKSRFFLFLVNLPGFQFDEGCYASHELGCPHCCVQGSSAAPGMAPEGRSQEPTDWWQERAIFGSSTE